ncbi:hypothetical protein G7085_06070 [Tessaracoccus sp. HDW20]|nr:hypothetical protein [Tessaracoccus coleopterorum]
MGLLAGTLIGSPTASADAAGNLVINPGFEQGITGWSASGGVFGIVPDAASGASSGSLSNRTAFYQGLKGSLTSPLAHDGQYRVTAKVKHTAGNATEPFGFAYCPSQAPASPRPTPSSRSQRTGGTNTRWISSPASHPTTTTPRRCSAGSSSRPLVVDGPLPVGRCERRPARHPAGAPAGGHVRGRQPRGLVRRRRPGGRVEHRRSRCRFRQCPADHGPHADQHRPGRRHRGQAGGGSHLPGAGRSPLHRRQRGPGVPVHAL